MRIFQNRRTSQVPGKPFPGSGDILEMPDFVSAIDPGPRKPSLESGNILELPASIGDSDSGPGKLSLEPGDMFSDITQFPGLAPSTSDVPEVRQPLTLVRPDFVCAFDPGPRMPSPESGDRLEMPDFASDLDLGLGKPSPESGASLEVPDFASASDPGSGKLSPEYGYMSPRNVLFLCFDTLTSAVSGSRHLSTSVTRLAAIGQMVTGYRDTAGDGPVRVRATTAN